MSNETLPVRRRPLRVMAWVWVLIVSVLSVVDHVRLSRSTEAQHLTMQSAQVAALKRRIALLETTVSAMDAQPARVSTEEFQATERARGTQLTQIETSLADVVHMTDLAPVQEQVTRLAAEVWRLRHPMPARPRADAHERSSGLEATHQKAEVPPPFMVLGTELRGGEEFLTVAPRNMRSLSDIRVLRPGEAAGDWKLDAIEGRAAVFETAGRLQRVPIS